MLFLIRHNTLQKSEHSNIDNQKNNDDVNVKKKYPIKNEIK